MLHLRVARTVVVMLALLSVASPGGAQVIDDVAETYDLGFKFTTQDRRFSLRLWGAIQFRYTYLDYDQRVEGNDTDYSNFFMRRARVWLAGNAFDPRFSYFVHIQLENTNAVNLHDMWLEYAFSDLLVLGLGRNKIAYGSEFLTSGFGLQFVERSVFSGETDIESGLGPVYPGGGTWLFGLASEALTGFATGGMNLYRSQGVQLRGLRGSSTTPTFEYQVGVWQGRATRGTKNIDNNHLYAARVGYHPRGRIDWRFQGDDEMSQRYRVGVFASAYTQSSSWGGGFHESGCNLAIMNRYRGLSVDAEWGTERFDFDRYDDDFERAGWRAQAGYMVVPKKVELVARYAEIERLRPATYRAAIDSGLLVPRVLDGDEFVTALERAISETTVGVNWYINQGHRHKLQVDASRLVREFGEDPDAVIDGEPAPITKVADQEDWRIRAMVQLVF
jgi:phosphate-selective porin OprO/OprP